MNLNFDNNEKFQKNNLFAIALLFFFVISCSKDDVPSLTTGDLFDKPLPVIKASIQGRWQLHYGKGGFIANQIHDWGNDDYWEFDFSNDANNIKAYDEPIKADTTITWVKEQDDFAGETYVMTFGYSGFTVLGIYNDTLVLKDFASDPISYYFTKQ